MQPWTADVIFNPLSADVHHRSSQPSGICIGGARHSEQNAVGESVGKFGDHSMHI